MNIVLVNDWAHVNGGVSQVVLTSADALSQRGHAVFVFSAVPAPAGTTPTRYKVLSTGQPEFVADANTLTAAARGLWNVRAQRLLGRLLDSLDPSTTLVHYHGWMKALSPSVLHEGLQRRLPAVTTLHEYFSACPNGGFYNYQTRRACTLDPLGAACLTTHCDSRGYPHKVWRVARQLVQRGAAGFPRHARHFIGVSRFSERILAPHLPADAVIHHVRNPIDVPRFEPAGVEGQQGFAFVGRLSPEKGADLLGIAAAAAGVPATFIGEGPSRAAVEAACPSARMAGWLSREQVWGELRRHRALVLPSLWYETQGLVVQEAAALGLPAIVPDTSAAAESVIDGQTGMLFRSGSAEDLRDKLAVLHADPLLAAQLGRAAYERYWADPPTLERHVDELERVYALVAAGAQESLAAGQAWSHG